MSTIWCILCRCRGGLRHLPLRTSVGYCVPSTNGSRLGDVRIESVVYMLDRHPILVGYGHSTEGATEVAAPSWKHRDGIRVVRSIKKSDRLDAHVVGIGRKWVLLAMATDGSPDGHVVLRIKDIKHIYWDPAERFIRRSLKAQQAWPPSPPSERVDLDHGVKELVESVAAFRL